MKRLRCAVATLVFLYFPEEVTSWPGSYSCDYACHAAQAPGAAFNHMGIGTYGAVTGDNCVISTDVPNAGFTAGQSYIITITSSAANGRKVACDRAVFAGGNIVNSADMVTSSTHAWTATGDATATFRALCGRGGGPGNRQMWVAVAVTANAATTTTTTYTGTTISQAATTTTIGQATTTVAGATSSGGLQPSLELLSGMKMGARVVQNELDVVVEADGSKWISIGFSSGNSVSMTAAGGGVDTYACVNGAVERYWMTTYSKPTGATAVDGSSCSIANGKTRMTFRRSLAGRRLSPVAITPGTGQVVIYARGTNTASLNFHGGDKGGQIIDFETLTASEADKKSGEAALYAHLICMALAWAALLPWAVTIASRTRPGNVPGQPKGAWYRMHRGLAVTGWVVQILGFVMAVWHVEENAGGSHFDNIHAIVGLIVVALGTLQPLNAVLRPHIEEGQAPSSARKLWQMVHKGSGYFAVIIGMFNVFAGVFLLQEDYDTATKAVALTLGLLGAVPVLGFLALSMARPNNALSRLCVGGTESPSKQVIPGGAVGKQSE